MKPSERLAEIEIRFGYGIDFDMSLRERDGHWLIARVKRLTEALEKCPKEIEGWENLLIKAHKDCPYANPKEAEREHQNKMNLLGVIKSKLTKLVCKAVNEE